MWKEHNATQQLKTIPTLSFQHWKELQNKSVHAETAYSERD
jgi:hypothetical protein